ncbi:MAG: hypothetical protein FJ356_05950 [Thaumarchaeota archaeon]|nr:hypothetical protein [Nitrososphaerota archaeon]
MSPILDSIGSVKGFGWGSFVSSLGDRGLFMGGYASGSESNIIDYITITSTGNATDFGDLSIPKNSGGSLASSTRAVHGGGYTTGGSSTAVMDYVTISTTGNATNFGNLVTGGLYGYGSSNETRGLFSSRYQYNGTIDYITIATTGNATNFGSLSTSRHGVGSSGSTTRVVHAGGETGVPVQTIDYNTIATTGNATNFGSLLYRCYVPASASSSTRALFIAGYDKHGIGYGYTEYVTIASTGNATGFGYLRPSPTYGDNAYYGLGAVSNKTRAVAGGGSNTGAQLDYFTIATTGDATNFGNLSVSRAGVGSASSNSHGGI